MSESALVTITQDYRNKLEERDLSDVLSDLRIKIDEGTQRMDDLDANVRRCITEELPEQVPDISDKEAAVVLRNLNTGAWHSMLHYGEDIERHLWRTKCGWPFGGAQVSLHEAVCEDTPWHRICPRCLGPLRAQRKRQQDAMLDLSDPCGILSDTQDCGGRALG